jgi:imidazolonepropionase-like amidohydrolase
MIRRESDDEQSGKKYARLAIRRGTVNVDASDARRTRQGTLSLRGTLRYNITAGHVETADLRADGAVLEASRDHLLFEARWEANPQVIFEYKCQIVSP